MMMLTKDVEEQVRMLCSNGQKLAAVKLYKDSSGLNLRESIDYVEQLTGEGSASMNNPTDLDVQVIELCNQGRKLEAIKIYREATNCGLKEAMDYVNNVGENQVSGMVFKDGESFDDTTMEDPKNNMGFLNRIRSFFTGDKA